MKVSVIGLGYVGLTVVGATANAGYEVYAYELSEDRIHKVQEMIMSDTHMVDGYLLFSIRENMQLVHFADIYDENLRMCDVKILCVDTINIPSAIQMLGPFIKPNDIVIVESTMDLGTCDTIRQLIELATGMIADKDFVFAFVPERVMEGKLLQNFERMPRAIGTSKYSSFKRVKKVYEALGVKGELQYTDPQHATAAKDFENAFRFIEIMIANEFADICREVGLEYSIIQKLVNVKGNEMGYNELLNSGIGVGGPCVPLAANLVAKMDWKNARLLRMAIELNMGRPYSLAQAIISLLKKRLGDLEDKKIAVLGATYRANGVDKRESLAVSILTILADEITPMNIYDPLWPNGSDLVQKMVPEDIEEEFDAVVILVGHNAFVDLSMMKCNYFIDLTGIVKKYPKKARRKKLQV